MINSENDKNRYSGNGVTTVFAYEYRVKAATDLLVIIADADDTQYTLTNVTHYTVSGVGVDTGGNVTTEDLTAITGETDLPTGWSITITRKVALLQETNFGNQGGFFAADHEDAFDYLTMIAQQQQEQLDRCPKVSQTSGETGDDIWDDLDAYTTAAQAAQSAAETAQGLAETARTGAETAETNAGLSATAASDSADAAAASVAAAGLPASLTGQNAKTLVVKATEDGYEFATLVHDFNDTFDNGDLAAGILTVTHSLNLSAPFVVVYDDSNNQITPDEVTYSDANNVLVDLSGYGVISGTWKVRVL